MEQTRDSILGYGESVGCELLNLVVWRRERFLMGVIDKYRFEKRGEVGCSNSDYRLHRATCCDGYCVEDDELSDLYFDPAGLSRRVSLLRERSDSRPLRCPFCGASEWDLAEVDRLADVPEDWRWACHSR